MTGEIKFLRETETSRIYEVRDLSVVTNDLVDALDWPERFRTLCVFFREPVENDFEVLDRNFSGKYMPRLVYRAQSSELISPEPAATCSGISEYSFPTVEALQDFYLHVERNYFGGYWVGRLGSPWREYLQGDYLKIIELNAKEHLPKAKVLCLHKNGAPVAFLPVNKTKSSGEDIDWITYVWIDRSLSRDERADAKRRMVEWLRRHADGPILTGVNPFNYPSNKFFRKIGFRSEFLQIFRPAKEP